ncbi:TRAP transporter small permease subunit [Rhodoligotrophos defluvii]|uniref:TRAP transporter small permease subunit n=1 Tax=Rhodoligotrophos defluvii TaxID=2561934 RepID=UPI0010C996C4|nr:TRAP transporter small permease [Rhodoligotrophos defluvii]
MKVVLDLVSWISRAGAVIAAILVVAMTGHILLEILLRVAFSRSTYVLEEFVGYGIAGASFMALAYTLETEGHIRVNLLLTRLGDSPLRKLVELLCIGTSFALTLFLCLYFWRSISRNWARGAVSETIAQVPLWIPEGFVLLGLGIFALQLVARALRVLVGSPSPRASLVPSPDGQ